MSNIFKSLVFSITAILIATSLTGCIQGMGKPDTFKETVLAGFSFNLDPVKIEIAKCNSFSTKYLQFLQCGVNDPETNLRNMNKELKDSGVEKIKTELKKQINEFLASKK